MIYYIQIHNKNTKENTDFITLGTDNNEYNHGAIQTFERNTLVRAIYEVGGKTILFFEEQDIDRIKRRVSSNKNKWQGRKFEVKSFDVGRVIK